MHMCDLAMGLYEAKIKAKAKFYNLNPHNIFFESKNEIVISDFSQDFDVFGKDALNNDWGKLVEALKASNTD